MICVALFSRFSQVLKGIRFRTVGAALFFQSIYADPGKAGPIFSTQGRLSDSLRYSLECRLVENGPLATTTNVKFA